MVVKRAWPVSSRFTPVAAPMGFSGAFSSVWARVVSAQRCSDAEGWRPSKTSLTGLSAMLLWSLFLFLVGSAIKGVPWFNHRRCGKRGASSRGNRSFCFLGVSSGPLAQDVLRVIAGLHFSVNPSHFFVPVRLEEDSVEHQRALHVETRSSRAGTGVINSKGHLHGLLGNKRLRRVSFRNLKTDMVLLNEGVWIVDRVFAQAALENALALGLEQSRGNQQPLAGCRGIFRDLQIESCGQRLILHVPSHRSGHLHFGVDRQPLLYLVFQFFLA